MVNHISDFSLGAITLGFPQNVVKFEFSFGLKTRINGNAVVNLHVISSALKIPMFGNSRDNVVLPYVSLSTVGWRHSSLFICVKNPHVWKFSSGLRSVPISQQPNIRSTWNLAVVFWVSSHHATEVDVIRLCPLFGASSTSKYNWQYLRNQKCERLVTWHPCLRYQAVARDWSW